MGRMILTIVAAVLGSLLVYSYVSDRNAEQTPVSVQQDQQDLEDRRLELEERIYNERLGESAPSQ